VVIKSVPPGATVVGIPGKTVEDRRKPVMDLEHAKLPDPVAEALKLVLKEQDKLEARLKRLESSAGITVSPDELSQQRKKMEQELELKEE
jgi:serine O-acetyltransferase